MRWMFHAKDTGPEVNVSVHGRLRWTHGGDERMAEQGGAGLLEDCEHFLDESVGKVSEGVLYVFPCVRVAR